MSIFHDLRISSKLLVGNGFVIFLLIVLSVNALWVMIGTTDAFRDYRTLAQQSNALGRIQSTVQELRLDVSSYREAPGNATHQAVRDTERQLRALLRDARQILNGGAVARSLDETERRLDRYIVHFGKLLTYRQDRDRLVDQLNAAGAAMNQNLRSIMESAHRDNDVQAAYLAGATLSDILEARVHVIKFLLDNSSGNAEEAKQHLDDGEAAAAHMLTELQDPERQRLAEDFRAQWGSYTTTLTSVRALIEERNGFIAQTLVPAGARMAEQTEQLKLDNLRRQETLGPTVAAEVERAEWVTLVLSLAAVVMAVLVGLLIGRGLSRPIEAMTTAMTRIADGETDADIPARGRRDEIGAMADAVAVFKENTLRAEQLARQTRDDQEAAAVRAKRMDALASGFDHRASGAISGVADAARGLEGMAQTLTETADQSSRQVTAMSSASEQASTNVETVAAAAEQLSGSIGEIGRQVAHSSRIANEAVASARKTDETVRGLVDAAQKIGEVVQLINNIASQTNLLALNATIEAARAGDAGKGFNVVANEVKSLATQTAKATDDIAAQIQGIQAVSKQAAGDIGDIGRVIGEINDISTNIAAAVEQQSAATQEISRNVQEAARGSQEVNSHISGLSDASAQTGSSARALLDSAGLLSRQAEDLRSVVGRFLEDMRSVRNLG